ncbi:MAG: hypothetical protein HQK53_02840 [Oligoflexia bacterium]|nr:hypothetical protein [Oligoflexia bacterium]
MIEEEKKNINSGRKKHRLLINVTITSIALFILFLGTSIYYATQISPKEIKKFATDLLYKNFPLIKIDIGDINYSLGISALKVKIANVDIKAYEQSLLYLKKTVIKIPFFSLFTHSGSFEVQIEQPVINFVIHENKIINWKEALSSNQHLPPSSPPLPAPTYPTDTNIMNSEGEEALQVSSYINDYTSSSNNNSNTDHHNGKSNYQKLVHSLAKSNLTVKIIDSEINYKDENTTFRKIILSKILIKNLNLKTPTAFELISPVTIPSSLKNGDQSQISFSSVLIGQINVNDIILNKNLESTILLKIDNLLLSGLQRQLPNIKSEFKIGRNSSNSTFSIENNSDLNALGSMKSKITVTNDIITLDNFDLIISLKELSNYLSPYLKNYIQNNMAHLKQIWTNSELNTNNSKLLVSGNASISRINEQKFIPKINFSITDNIELISKITSNDLVNVTGKFNGELRDNNLKLFIATSMLSGHGEMTIDVTHNLDTASSISNLFFDNNSLYLPKFPIKMHYIDKANITATLNDLKLDKNLITKLYSTFTTTSALTNFHPSSSQTSKTNTVVPHITSNVAPNIAPNVAPNVAPNFNSLPSLSQVPHAPASQTPLPHQEVQPEHPTSNKIGNKTDNKKQNTNNLLVSMSSTVPTEEIPQTATAAEILPTATIDIKFTNINFGDEKLNGIATFSTHKNQFASDHIKFNLAKGNGEFKFLQELFFTNNSKIVNQKQELIKRIRWDFFASNLNLETIRIFFPPLMDKISGTLSGMAKGVLVEKQSIDPNKKFSYHIELDLQANNGEISGMHLDNLLHKLSTSKEMLKKSNPNETKIPLLKEVILNNEFDKIVLKANLKNNLYNIKNFQFFTFNNDIELRGSGKLFPPPLYGVLATFNTISTVNLDLIDHEGNLTKNILKFANTNILPFRFVGPGFSLSPDYKYTLDQILKMTQKNHASKINKNEKFNKIKEKYFDLIHSNNKTENPELRPKKDKIINLLKGLI